MENQGHSWDDIAEAKARQHLERSARVVRISQEDRDLQMALENSLSTRRGDSCAKTATTSETDPELYEDGMEEVQRLLEVQFLSDEMSPEQKAQVELERFRQQWRAEIEGA